MPLVKNNINQFKVIDNQVHLSPEYLQKCRGFFKKITGSRIASVLGFSKYDSPFKTWMIMTNLFKDVFDPTLAKVGNAVEPIVRDYLTKILNQKYLVYDPSKINWDVFKENTIFGGVPDGEPINSSGAVDYTNASPMIEIKTTSIDSFVYVSKNSQLQMQKDNNGYPIIKQPRGKYNSWFQDGKIQLSYEYALQLGLYLYLRNVNYGMFAVAFLQCIDYVYPEKFDVSQREIKLIDFYIDRNKFQQYISIATKWYQQHIIIGISPVMTDKDKQWLENELAQYDSK